MTITARILRNTPRAAKEAWGRLQLFVRDTSGYLLVFVAFWLLACIVIGGLAGLFLLAVWRSGGLNTGGPRLDWNAVGALAAIGAAMATTAGVAALVFALAELAGRSRDERVTWKPYLRTDIGFKEPRGASPGFRAPPSSHYFTAADFRLGDHAAALEPLRPRSPFDKCFTLVLWVTNQQTAPVGTAYRIHATVILAWSESLESNQEEPVPVEIEFVYIEPSHTTAIELCTVRADLPVFLATIAEVTYEDVFGRVTLVDRHGAMSLLYAGGEGLILNERQFQLGR